MPISSNRQFAIIILNVVRFYSLLNSNLSWIFKKIFYFAIVYDKQIKSP